MEAAGEEKSHLMTLFLREKLLAKLLDLVVLVGEVPVYSGQLVLLHLEIVHHVDHLAHLLVMRGSQVLHL